MAEATPRITAPYLDQFSHRTVRILGKVRQLRGEEATVDAGGQIRVHQIKVPSPSPYHLAQHNSDPRLIVSDVILQDSNWHLNHAVEIIGKVQQDLSVKVMASTDMGPEGGIGASLPQSRGSCFSEAELLIDRK